MLVLEVFICIGVWYFLRNNKYIGAFISLAVPVGVTILVVTELGILKRNNTPDIKVMEIELESSKANKIIGESFIKEDEYKLIAKIVSACIWYDEKKLSTSFDIAVKKEYSWARLGEIEANKIIASPDNVLKSYNNNAGKLLYDRGYPVLARLNWEHHARNSTQSAINNLKTYFGEEVFLKENKEAFVQVQSEGELNMRSSPGIESSIVFRLRRSARIKLTGKTKIIDKVLWVEVNTLAGDYCLPKNFVSSGGCSVWNGSPPQKGWVNKLYVYDTSLI